MFPFYFEIYLIITYSIKFFILASGENLFIVCMAQFNRNWNTFMYPLKNIFRKQNPQLPKVHLKQE